MTDACRAAVEVAEQLGLGVDEPLLIQETNNTVVWLRPHAVIAKVATRAASVERLLLEHEVATALAGAGAEVAPPLPGALPRHHRPTGFVVTLWRRLDHDAAAEVPGRVAGASMRRLHGALAACDVRLPSFRVELARARAALSDDRRMAALAPDERAFLRAAFDGLLGRLDERPVVERPVVERPLHGEPHRGNWLWTPAGIRWIDFENACRGPLEWDLAFLPDDALGAFAEVDEPLLDLLRLLNSARVSTWCWVQARFPEMRWHGEHHLEVLRRSWPPR